MLGSDASLDQNQQTAESAMSLDDPHAGERWDLQKMVITSGWITAIAVAASILLSIVYLSLAAKEVPPVLKEFGVACLTFLFTQFRPLLDKFFGDSR